MVYLVSWLLAAFLCLSTNGTFAKSLAPPQVNLGYSTYQGYFNASANVTAFLGIRYAAAPVGNLRWRAPQSPSPTSGVLNATAQPPQCYQAAGGTSQTNPSRTVVPRDSTNPDTTEDCLFLNVYVPGNLDPSKKYPVVVWIHGGGYEQGRASIFNGGDLVNGADQSIISVVIQYRLGLFGFLSSGSLKADGNPNAGLLDQEFALKWVQQNIGKFGGDKSKVAIWGESAGAGSVLLHVVAHAGKTNPPLFRAALASSSYVYAQYNYNHQVPEACSNFSYLLYTVSYVGSQAQFAKVANATGCAQASNKLACLRAADISLLEAANLQIGAAGFYSTGVFLPVVDGTIITERPIQTLQRGRVNGEVFFSMENTFEGRVNVNAAAVTNLRDYVTQLLPVAPAMIIDAVVNKYQQLPGTPGDQAIAVYGEGAYSCSAYFLLKAFSGRAWKGEFALPPANHEQEVQYYFWPSYQSFVPGPPQYNNVDWRKAFAQSFFSVIKSLDPNVKYDPTNIRPNWPKWSISNPTEMLFNKTETDEPVIHTKQSGALLDRCNFWESIAPFIPY